MRLLDGIRVIDAASFIAGPVAATVMADLGAQVIKVEPPAGDTYRLRNAGYPPSPYNFPWIVDNRSKRGLALDLRAEAGQRVLHRVIAGADVFVTNVPLDGRARLGVRWEDLAPLNPRLIYASITAYGETGAEAARPGFDSTALWARSGLMDLVRPSPDSPPARSLPGMGDHPTGMSLFGAIMAALYQRERTGRGNYVSSSLLANGLWANGCSVQAALCGDPLTVQPPREAAVNALRVHYRCADGRWLLLSIASDEWRWDKFKGCLDDPALDDPRYADVASREENARALVRELDRIFATCDLAYWRRVLDEAGLIFGIVAETADIASDEQVLAAGHLVPVAEAGYMTVNSPIEIGGQEKVAPRRAPDVGEHSEQVLREAGYPDTEIAALREAGIIG